METIEQASKNYSTSLEDNDYLIETEAAFMAGVAFCQRWIPIEEEKPTQQGCYFVKCKTSYPKNCDVVVAEFYEDNKTFYSESSDCPLHDVTHWRPIERP